MQMETPSYVLRYDLNGTIFDEFSANASETARQLSLLMMGPAHAGRASGRRLYC
jgi:hypothetical protein